MKHWLETRVCLLLVWGWPGQATCSTTAILMANKIGDQGLASLGARVAKLSNLQHLSLGLIDCDKIGDQGLASLAEELAKLKALADVDVSVGDWRHQTCLDSRADLQSYAKMSRDLVTSIWR